MNLVLNQKKVAADRSLNQVLNVDLENNVIEIYDVIMPWRWSDDDTSVTVEDVTSALKNIRGDVEVRINSRGGEVGSALAIYNRLKDHTGNVHTIVDGYAFSSAGWIAQAGSKRDIATGGVFMLHNPHLVRNIDSEETINAAASQWRAHHKSIVDIFEKTTSVPREELTEMMQNETYLSAEDAVEKGFFDSVYGEQADLSALNYAAPASLPQKYREALPLPINYLPLKLQRQRLLASS